MEKIVAYVEEYEEYKNEHFKDAETISSSSSESIIDALKRNACLVEILAGHKSLAEDIFTNALVIERKLKEIAG